MSAQHTPGPWVHHPEDNIITTPNGFCKLLEWQARSMHVPQAERDANARLISASPDLLAALNAYRDAIHFAQDKQALMTAIADADAKAATAIAKATGGVA